MGSKSQFECAGGEWEKKILSLLGIEPGFRGHPAHIPVTALTVLQEVSLCSMETSLTKFSATSLPMLFKCQCKCLISQHMEAS